MNEESLVQWCISCGDALLIQLSVFENMVQKSMNGSCPETT